MAWPYFFVSLRSRFDGHRLRDRIGAGLCTLCRRHVWSVGRTNARSKHHSSNLGVGWWWTSRPERDTRQWFGHPSVFGQSLEDRSRMAALQSCRLDGREFLDHLGFVFSTLPGAVLGSIAQNNNYPPIFTAACIIASVWLLLPIFLLSMLDNQNIFQPFSMDVFRSLSQKPEAWGGYYIISAIGAFCAWMMVTFALSNPSMGTIVAGMTLPLLMFFLFHQMGVLASVISEVTSLGFEAEAKPSNPE